MADAPSSSSAPAAIVGTGTTSGPAGRASDRGPNSPRADWGLAALVIALLPALGAIWAVPWFVTQDAPAHVYNAEILSRSTDPGSPFAGTFAIRWQPIPNWVGHLLLAGLLRIVPAWAADRIITCATLAGFAAAIFWLRRRVSGSGPGDWVRDVPAALLAALLAMNITWLFGFTSFTMGACLFPITLGFWWSRRDRLGAGGVAGLWVLLILGYFCHLVSLGLTVLGLSVLAVATPVTGGREGSRWRIVRERLVPLAVAFLPMVPLGLMYLGLAHRGGPMRPQWENLTDPWSLSGWKNQLTWADPISLVRKDALPFTDRVGAVFIVLAPVFWTAAALVVWGATRAMDRMRRGSVETTPGARTGPHQAGVRLGWWAFAALLIVGGIAGPDTLGPEHGNYLPQRIVLCGLVSLAVVVDIDLRRGAGRAAAAGLAAAVALQSAVVWDYALYSDRTAGEIVRARDAVGRGRRVAFLPASVRSRFRANPLIHVDNWLGVDTDNIIWGNYETRHYYFPVQFRPGLERPSPEQLEGVMRLDDPRDAARRARLWEDVLARNAAAIDVLVAYGSDPLLDAVSARFFHEVRRQGQVRILVRDPARSLASTAGIAKR